ncbi:vacuolar protein sorting-associated protein 41 [Yamadazyma tenuis ATCC 10573]|uniref:Vacuolar protein sorting-associated protein 41 n=1 Tax=Candida tenuis (strain ATCC 10573 / BCRC 21748 / CBS 615 / JCM 9827 / NBRC 10315 / NRRL Y-1498 / VKM Y-70) TaxID=590646 RepID=G3BA49_CANTC|nr:vacuolar protein sorting-associated protein 41 [Yamadazyma tenuis ATCC 10573]EGV62009.1 vacuolar protein sorting-associated protein 41 [Yamadazyma tenuis ATCC 10573]
MEANTEDVDEQQGQDPIEEANRNFHSTKDTAVSINEPVSTYTSHLEEAPETDDDNDTVGNTTFETTYGSDEDDSNDVPGEADIQRTEEIDAYSIDEEDEPPKLKYSRITGLPPNFFSRDPVSCCNIHDDYYIFATHSGIIHVTDPNFTTIRTFKAHRASILSIYTDGQFFASGSMDGTIVIGSIKDEKDIIAYDFKRPIHAVVLDPNYSRTRSFVSGGMAGKVIHSSKNWLGQRSDIVLDENNGPIVAIHSVDDILLWMNDKGISIFHTQARQVIKVIDKPEDSPRSDLYWPRVHSLEMDRVLIGWANYIWCIRVSIRTSEDKSEMASNKSRILPSAATISFRAVQEKKVEIEHVFKLDSLIAGISSFTDDYWMILSYEPPTADGDEKVKFNYPDLKLINSLNGEVDFEEEIGMKNIDNLGLNDYSLHRHIGSDSTSYFVVSAKDGIIAQEVQLNDRLDWYISHDRYRDAWEISEHLLSPEKRLNLGLKHVDNLVRDDGWELASQLLAEYFSSSMSYDEDFVKNVVSQWESWSSIFIQANHIKELTEVIPRSPKFSLSASIYDSILSYWIGKNVSKTVELISEWDVELYDSKKVESLMETSLEGSESSILRKCLADLYVKTYKPQKAVEHLMKLKDPNLFMFLADNHLLTNFLSDIPQIIKLKFSDDEYNNLPLKILENKLRDVIQVLVDHRHELNTRLIFNLMEQQHLTFINYLYLEKLNDIDDFLLSSFGDERVKLYSEFDRPKLLPFLMRSSDYDIDLAISICESSDFIEELVYLLGKIGENKKALTLIIDKLNDPEVAINFAKHQNDREAWNILLDESMTRPAFIKALIETADDQSNPFYDPISILKRIPNNVKIEGLKNSVSKINENNELNYLMNQLILKLIYGRSEAISKGYRRNLLKGYEIETNDAIFKELIGKFQTILFYNDSLDSNPVFKSQSEMFPQGMAVTAYTNLDKKLEHLQFLTNYLKSKSANDDL